MTKFNASWQLARVKARDIKTVSDKIKFILGYFSKNCTKADKERVLNWFKTTKLGYPKTAVNINKEFDIGIDKVQSKNCTTQDNSSKISDLSVNEIKLILQDLNKRKYNFQFKRTPKEHINFVQALEKELKTR